ncbi:MAG: hypothetical protein Q7K03_08315 [Dehalococcoidia bacterium]|nr:hypothetical protein [Dehalococcoidia bacterium]
MSKRMTVIFEDEALYTALKVEAARTGRHAKDIVAEAVQEWLEAREDEELRADLEERRTEWEEKGGRSWIAVERDMERAVSRKEKEAQSASV